ncbi:unnamed protein product [Lactuca saligna]|uniref:Uncharacterized protein n=1 Tax=Lactuca saligna TaxID=75948 RepID=A0AA35ZQE2_LACSI|nr:unnamed protein product [Lactuca saligna]
MPPPIFAPIIAQINVSSLTKKPDDIPEDLLVPLLFELVIVQTSLQIISSIFSHEEQSADKGKRIATDSDNPVKSSEKPKGWLKEQLQQALEDIQIQALKDNPNSMLRISPLFREWILLDIHFVPFMYFDFPIDDADQLDIPISPHRRYYIKFDLHYLFYECTNPNGIAHLQDLQTNETSIGAYNSTISFLKDYITGFCRSSVEFGHLFGIENHLANITIELPRT